MTTKKSRVVVTWDDCGECGIRPMHVTRPVLRRLRSQGVPLDEWVQLDMPSMTRMTRDYIAVWVMYARDQALLRGWISDVAEQVIRPCYAKTRQKNVREVLGTWLAGEEVAEHWFFYCSSRYDPYHAMRCWAQRAAHTAHSESTLSRCLDGQPPMFDRYDNSQQRAVIANWANGVRNNAAMTQGYYNHRHGKPGDLLWTGTEYDAIRKAQIDLLVDHIRYRNSTME